MTYKYFFYIWINTINIVKYHVPVIYFNFRHYCFKKPILLYNNLIFIYKYFIILFNMIFFIFTCIFFLIYYPHVIHFFPIIIHFFPYIFYKKNAIHPQKINILYFLHSFCIFGGTFCIKIFFILIYFILFDFLYFLSYPYIKYLI